MVLLTSDLLLKSIAVAQIHRMSLVQFLRHPLDGSQVCVGSEGLKVRDFLQ